VIIRHLSVLAIGALLALAGCATPADRITTKLVELGVPQPQARCMGLRLNQRLSLAQLDQLGRLAYVDREQVGRMSLREIGNRLRSIHDPAIVAEILSAGVGCAI
jgi:hypothetical protein